MEISRLTKSEVVVLVSKYDLHVPKFKKTIKLKFHCNIFVILKLVKNKKIFCS